MTTNELVGTGVGLISIAISIAAFIRAGQADHRDREAIIVVRKLWKRQGDRSFMIPGTGGKQTQFVEPNPRPHKPDQQLVISGKPTIDKGLALRPETSADAADRDVQGNATDRVLVEVQNLGRSPATSVTIACTLIGRFIRFSDGVEDREFAEQAIFFEALAPNVPRYVEVRSMPGIPVRLSFDSVLAGNKQPARLIPPEPIGFHARG